MLRLVSAGAPRSHADAKEVPESPDTPEAPGAAAVVISIRKLATMLDCSRKAAYRVAEEIGYADMKHVGWRVRLVDAQRYIDNAFGKPALDESAAPKLSAIASASPPKQASEFARSGKPATVGTTHAVNPVVANEDEEVIPGITRRELNQRLAKMKG